jgi:hypothetical protein
MLTTSQSGAVSRKVIVWLAIPCALVALAIVWGAVVQHNNQRARADWKAVALSRLAALSFTNEDISRELETLRASGGAGDHRDWVSDHILWMTNGEFLIFEFRHGLDGGSVEHLFLARSSEGRWYYSTYHFCNSMVAVMGDQPPGSIAEFATRYSAREFDGKSDACLQHTWPVQQ